MSATSPESVAVENVTKNLAAAGYDVIREPSRDLLPEFLDGYRPDLIAFKTGEKSLVVEVRRKGATEPEKLSQVRARFDGQDEWAFTIVWLDPVSTTTIAPPSMRALVKRVTDLEKTKKAGLYSAALVVCWAIFEALARSFFPERLGKPQAPKSVVQQLESEGLIDAKEASRLRVLATRRNSFVHGMLEDEIDERDVTFFQKVIARLMRDLSVTIDAASDTPS